MNTTIFEEKKSRQQFKFLFANVTDIYIRI